MLNLDIFSSPILFFVCLLHTGPDPIFNSNFWLNNFSVFSFNKHKEIMHREPKRKQGTQKHISMYKAVHKYFDTSLSHLIVCNPFLSIPGPVCFVCNS